MLGFLIKKVFGTKNDREVKRMRPIVAQMNEIQASLQSLPDEALRQKTADWKARLGAIEDNVELAAALESFENNLSECVSPAILARRARLTPSKLARLIHRFFDLTPSQFLTQTRLTAAARLLRETDLGVSEIAQECGFYDHSAFSRAFHSAMGVTPSAYREATLKENRA